MLFEKEPTRVSAISPLMFADATKSLDLKDRDVKIAVI